MSVPRKAYDRLGPVAYNQNIQDAILTPPTGERVVIGKVILSNRSGGAVDVGFGYEVPAAGFTVSDVAYVNGTANTITNVTTNAQSTTANAWTVVAATTDGDNDGFIISSPYRFHAFNLRIDSNSAGNGTYTYAFSNGTAFNGAPTYVRNVTYSGTNATYDCSVFVAPQTWAQSASTNTNTGLINNNYQLLVKWTTAPATRAFKASSLRLYRLVEFYPQLANNAEVAEDFGETEFVCPRNASVVPFFGGTANVANQVKLDFRIRSS